MQKAFKFRAYPRPEQVIAMEELLETHRRLYNNALYDRKHCFETENRPLHYNEQSGSLKTARQQNPYLARANFSSCQRTLKRLDRAFQGFFRRVKAGDKPGYPRFRGQGRFDSVEFTATNGARLTGEGKAYFQSVGAVKLKMHRPMEGIVKTITFRKQADGWFIIFLCDVDPGAVMAPTSPPVGIDLGLKSFLVASSGEKVAPPRFCRKSQAKLRRAQRSVERKKKGGANRRKAVQRLARHHRHISDQRRDFHHKTAFDLVARYGFIAHEALNIEGIARSWLAKSTRDAGWAQFLKILGHKAACAGVSVVAVDPRFTTQTCSRCGGLPAVSLSLSVRRYECSHCSLSLDRDVNAARNILKRAWIGPLGANVEDLTLMRGPRSLRL